MHDNILIGPDAQGRFNLQMLRAHQGQGAIKSGKCKIIDGVYLDCDPDAVVTGRYRSDADNMLNIRIQASRNPRWQALHVELGDLRLGDAAVVGVVARSRAEASITTRLCLRSGNGGHFVDSFFSKTMVSFAQPSIHLDVMDLAANADLPKQAEWRDLILFFRAGDVSVDLLDIRLFAV
jgi:hypothetical protein